MYNVLSIMYKTINHFLTFLPREIIRRDGFPLCGISQGGLLDF